MSRCSCTTNRDIVGDREGLRDTEAPVPVETIARDAAARVGGGIIGPAVAQVEIGLQRKPEESGRVVIANTIGDGEGIGVVREYGSGARAGRAGVLVEKVEFEAQLGVRDDGNRLGEEEREELVAAVEAVRQRSIGSVGEGFLAKFKHRFEPHIAPTPARWLRPRRPACRSTGFRAGPPGSRRCRSDRA